SQWTSSVAAGWRGAAAAGWRGAGSVRSTWMTGAEPSASRRDRAIACSRSLIGATPSSVAFRGIGAVPARRDGDSRTGAGRSRWSWREESGADMVWPALLQGPYQRVPARFRPDGPLVQVHPHAKCRLDAPPDAQRGAQGARKPAPPARVLAASSLLGPTSMIVAA